MRTLKMSKRVGRNRLAFPCGSAIGAEGARTLNLAIANRMLSRLSYRPDCPTASLAITSLLPTPALRTLGLSGRRWALGAARGGCSADNPSSQNAHASRGAGTISHPPGSSPPAVTAQGCPNRKGPEDAARHAPGEVHDRVSEPVSSSA